MVTFLIGLALPRRSLVRSLDASDVGHMRWSIPLSAALAFCLLGGQIAAAHSTQARPAIHQRVARSVPSTSHQAPASPVLAPALTSPLSRRAEAVVPSGTSTALANKLDVTYGILGALLILTGVPTTASGFDNKRYVH